MAGGGKGAKLAKGALSSLFGGGGGGSGGGVSPQQAALAQYTMAQQDLAGNNFFGSRGMGMSTNATMQNIGAQMGGALSLAQMADMNAQANQQVANAATANQGFNQGFNSQGNFGTQSGNFGNQGGSTTPPDLLSPGSDNPTIV
jgi:hypothetical protein